MAQGGLNLSGLRGSWHQDHSRRQGFHISFTPTLKLLRHHPSLAGNVWLKPEHAMRTDKSNRRCLLFECLNWEHSVRDVVAALVALAPALAEPVVSV